MKKIIFYRIEDSNDDAMYLITEPESEGLNLNLIISDKEVRMIRTIILTKRSVTSYTKEMLQMTENVLNGNSGIYGELPKSKVVEFSRWVGGLLTA
jgi:hypothetical protein